MGNMLICFPDLDVKVETALMSVQYEASVRS